MLTISKKYLFFHPILWTLIGYMLWMFIPPFFTAEGHMWKLVFIDLIGFCFLFFGYFFGATVKKTFIPNYKLTIRHKNITTLIISFILIIYCVRVYLFSKVGIYAFMHPNSRESSLIDTLSRNLMWPYIVLITTMLVLTRKKIYGILLFLEFIFFIIPTLARSYYINFVIDFMFIQVFFFNFKLKKIIKYLPLLGLMLFLIKIFGPYMHSVRSFVYINQIEKVEQVSFESSKDDNFLIDRLNVHGLSWVVKPVIAKAAEIDQTTLTGMFSKWFGFSKDYSMRPSLVSYETGLLVGDGATSHGTSTDIPRNYVLMNYSIGMLAVFLFNIILGFIFAITYQMLYIKNNLLFLVLWFPFVYDLAFGGQGSMTSTFVFQYLLNASAFVTLLIVFVIVKYLKKIRLYPRELPQIYSQKV